tara:strand:- start:549 stop:761 length:213 start_codon:yes stop_codon:yes gene_type:complete
MDYNLFELFFKAELKRLKLRKKDVAEGLAIQMPTLKTRVEDPDLFKITEIKNLREMGFDTDTMLNLIINT